MPDPPTPHWHAGWNQPGYLPDTAPEQFDTYTDARHWLADELDRHADNAASWSEPHDCDDIPCPSYGDSCPWQAAQDMRAAHADLTASGGPAWTGHADRHVYWIAPCAEADCPHDGGVP